MEMKFNNLIVRYSFLSSLILFYIFPAAPNCTLPYGYSTLSLAVCHIDNNGLPYCAYGQNYTLEERKLCDASGLPTAQYTACDILNITNPCNTTTAFPIRCVAADNGGWTCFCEVTQTLGKDCANLGKKN
jgi:hypothetical protein